MNRYKDFFKASNLKKKGLVEHCGRVFNCITRYKRGVAFYKFKQINIEVLNRQPLIVLIGQ